MKSSTAVSRLFLTHSRQLFIVLASMLAIALLGLHNPVVAGQSLLAVPGAEDGTKQVGEPVEPSKPSDPTNPNSPNAIAMPNGGTCSGCAGTAWSVTNTGTGRAGYYVLSNTTSANPALEGRTSSTAANARGVMGYVTATTAGSGSAGVYGLNASTNASGYGVLGKHNGNGIGVYGLSANGVGVYGSSSNTGLYGLSTATSGGGRGVYGEGRSPAGYGGYFLNAATSGNAIGIYGETKSNAGIAVRAQGGQHGVYATGTSEGVYAESANNAIEVLGTGYAAALYARNSANSWAVYGVTSSDYDGNAAVTGINEGQGYGVEGESGTASGDGVYGTGNTGVRGVGASNGEGVIGRADGSLGWGVWGASAAGRGVYGSTTTGWAGYFAGNVYVNGDIDVTGSYLRPIDHPLDPANQYLQHTSIQSSEMLNLYTGNVVLNGKGEAAVALPAWFAAANRDFRYQLTPIGAPGPNLYVSQKIVGNRFFIAGGTPGTEVSWEVSAVRGDVYARDHAFQAEVAKPVGERGTYLYPEGYGQSKSRSLNAADETRETQDARLSTRKPEGPPEGDRTGPAPQLPTP